MPDPSDPTRTAAPGPASAADAATVSFHATASPYTDLTPHARGGLGEVLRASDPQLHRTVAVKRLRENRAGDPAARRRFLVEAEVTARLEHPGVVPVYTLFRDESGGPAYAMRFVEGPTLADAIRAYHAGPGDAVAFRRLLQFVHQVCQTIAYAHSRGVIHRDLKPQNVLLGKFGETLVVDWGLAKVVGRPDDVRAEPLAEETLVPSSGSGDGETALGSAVGTPAYMSPEQAAGRWDVVDARSDVYGLGAVLYTVLTGKPPLGTGDWPELNQRIQQGDIPRPRQVKPDVPRVLEAVCLRAMAVRPADRYPSAEAAAAELECWLADEPVGACREPLPARARRWMRGHRTLVSAASVLLVTALAASAAGLVLLGRKNQEVAAERNAAQEAAAEAAAVNAFLTDDLLGQADPGVNSRDRKVTVEEVLAKAAAKIEGNPKFADQPLVEASLRVTIGHTFVNLSKYTEAEGHLRRAVELRRAHLPPNDPRTLAAQEALTDLLAKWLGRPADAETLGRETWEARRMVLGPTHRDTLDSLDTYAWVVKQLGRTDEALVLMRECLAGRRETLGSEDRDTLGSMNNLAVLLGARGEWAEAADLLREVLHVYERDEVDFPRYAPAANLGLNLYFLGRLDEAEKILARYADRAAQRLSREHEYTHVFRAFLARVLIDQGKASQAVEPLTEAIAARRIAFPKGDWRTASFLADLGRAKLAVGEPGEAAKAFAEARQMFRTDAPPSDYYTHWAEAGHGMALLALDRRDEAESTLLAAERRLRGLASCPARHYRKVVEALANLYEGSNKPEQAAHWRKLLVRQPVDPPAGRK